ncbi:MAG: sugar-binding protein [Granulosicoccaceae bacterium]
MNKPVCRFIYSIACAVALLSLVACDNNEPTIDFVVGTDASTVSLQPPSQLMTKAVVQQALSPSVMVNGEPVVMSQEDAPSLKWTGTTTVPPGTDTTLTILWNEAFGPIELPLASVTRELGVINSNSAATVGSGQYIFDIHDNDSDGFSNLDERINDTDPLDEFEPGAQSATVFINQIDPSIAPLIDGLWETNNWPTAQFQDRNRVRLYVNNLMVDIGATQIDQEPSYRWGAMHDGINLYLMIFTESVRVGQTPTSDSVMAYRDDAIDVFIDGDNSKTSSYDGINDHHMIIPIFEKDTEIPSNSRSLDRRDVNGDNALPFPAGVEYAACRCNDSSIGEYTLEMKIPLAEVGITVGQPFGIEIQYNDDKDGGDRDAKWGWFHPSKTPTGPTVDFTWQNPQFMGTAELLGPNGRPPITR